ncbi:unnamed protein product [Diplocarpon coronariae]|uniref:Uncharacterized protein n=1 Tax=Diplocarpon coronariae TaxID=2795749 RepID=A0A218ZCE9_9HELO|nr:hypothetical protein B2J93_8365 [Marssonina coronariae]
MSDECHLAPSILPTVGQCITGFGRQVIVVILRPPSLITASLLDSTCIKPKQPSRSSAPTISTYPSRPTHHNLLNPQVLGLGTVRSHVSTPTPASPIPMCNYEQFQWLCSHKPLKLLSYCHFARTDPWHQCFGSSVIVATWMRNHYCDDCLGKTR